jgi:hypothetical protein
VETIHPSWHPSEDELEEYSFGRSSGAMQRAIDEHLVECPACWEVLAAVEEYILLVKAAASEAPRPQPSTWRIADWPRKLKWASGAGVTLAATLVLAAWISPSKETLPARTVIPVTLDAYRGGNASLFGHAQAHHPLLLSIDAKDMPSSPLYRIELVNKNGNKLWGAMGAPEADRILVTLPQPPPPGTYWVRVYSARDEVLREFGLRLD